MASHLQILPPPERAALLMACVTALGTASCGRPVLPAKAPDPPVDVGVVVVHRSDVPLTSQLTGRVTPVDMAEVRPQVDGIVTSKDFVEGSLVRAGQLLYTVDPAPYQAAVAQAQATLAGAEASAAAAAAQAARYRSITDGDALSGAQIDAVKAAAAQSRAAVQGAQASLAAARLNLARTRVLAPISGRIGRSLILPGALVTARQSAALAVIAKEDEVNVDVEEPSDALLAARRAVLDGRLLASNRTVRLTLPDGSSYPYPGELAFTEATVNADTGMAVMRARFPNPDRLLIPGMFVRVQTPTGVAREAVLAPDAGVERDPRGGATALVVDPHDRVDLRALKVGDAMGGSWLVTSGLRDGDRLIVEGTAKVQPGDRVHPVPSQAASAA